MKTIAFLLMMLTLSTVACNSNTNDRVNGIHPPQTPVPIEDVVQHTGWSNAVNIHPPRTENLGISLGYLQPENLDLPLNELPQNEEYRLGPGEVFAPYLILGSKEPTTMLITAVRNYEQVPFKLDGRVGVLHEVQVPAQMDVEIPMEIEFTEEGHNDFMVLAFENPYNGSLDASERLRAFSDVAGRRVSIFVGETSDPAIDFELERRSTSSTVHTIPTGLTLGFPAMFSEANDVHPGEAQLYVSRGHKPGERFNFRLWSSGHDTKQRFQQAIMLFQNFRQVPLGEQNAVFIELDPTEEYIDEFHVTLPQQVGVNQLEFVTVYDPYHSLLDEDVLNPLIHSSFRLAVETTE